jgi:hypothetical protein
MPLKQPCTAHAFFPKCLSYHCQCLHLIFSEICTLAVGSTVKLHQATYSNLNKRS